MPVAMPPKMKELSDSISNAAEFKERFWKMIGTALDTIEPFGPRVLIGTFIKPTKTAGGIIMPDKTKQEDQWQGNCGLVLKMGKKAFKWDEDCPTVEWDSGDPPKVGDFVMFRYSDSREFYLNGMTVRWVLDRNIEAKVADPMKIY